MFSFTTTRFESTRGTLAACRRQSFAKCKQSKRRKAAPKFEAPLRYASFRFKFHLASNFVCFPTALFLTIPEIDYNLLPEKFVLKCTHDCGSIVICEDKKTFDAERAGKKLSAAMRMNYFWVGREWPYKNVRPRIIAEKYLENGAEGLHDYKVWCFNGEPKLIQYVTGRDRGTTYDSFYNTDWQRQNISFHNPPCPYETPKPARLDDLLRMAKTLAADIPFVRCDFYILEDDSIVFGEMTFFPMGGTESWKPKEWDLKLGEMLDLSGVKTQSKSNDQDN